jgi:predicted TIM-barrel fold metal-dependent hydrolase
MRIVDSHVHALGHEDADMIVRAMDRVRIDAICLLSPPWLETVDRQREALDWMALTVGMRADRLYGYFWVNPLLPEAPDLVRRARSTPGIRAIKLMSDHWYPYDERIRPTLTAIEEAEFPVLFHAGILWSHMDSSRFCRPADFEVMLHYPRIKFTLAHIGWPWVDECLAVQARMRDGVKKITGGENPMYIDLSPGTPMPVREEALRKALLLGEPARLLWGSDDTEPDKLEKASRTLAHDLDLLANTLEAKDETLSRVFGLNHLEFLGIPA